jgi:hypothetical protein
MQIIGMHLVQQHGLVDALGLDTPRLAKFLQELENGMPSRHIFLLFFSEKSVKIGCLAGT